MNSSPLCPSHAGVIAAMLVCFLFSALVAVSADGVVTDISGCPVKPSIGYTSNCNPLGITTLTIQGSGFLPFAPDNFQVFIPTNNITSAPTSNNMVVSDTVATFTVDQTFWIGLTSVSYTLGFQWGSNPLVYSIRPRISLVILLPPTPNITMVTGCTDYAGSSYNCYTTNSAWYYIAPSGGFLAYSTYTESSIQGVIRPLGFFPLPSNPVVNDTHLMLQNVGGSISDHFPLFQLQGLNLRLGPLSIATRNAITFSPPPPGGCPGTTQPAVNAVNDGSSGDSGQMIWVTIGIIGAVLALVLLAWIIVKKMRSNKLAPYQFSNSLPLLTTNTA